MIHSLTVRSRCEAVGPRFLRGRSHRELPPRSQRRLGEKVDKTHHLKLDGFMKHADKCLQLGEKPFLSVG